MVKSGYSRSGLLKLAEQGRIVFDLRGGRRLYNVRSLVPARVRKVVKVSG
jgi:hypothetical protein